MTNIDLIKDALMEIGVVNESETPSAEQSSHALRKLNQVLEAMEESGISLGWCEQIDSSATTPLPPYAEIGITATLAIALAPSYGGAASVTEALIAQADLGMTVIRRKAAISNLTPSDSRNLPRAEAGISTFNILTG